MEHEEEKETRAVLFVDDEENVLRSLKRLFLDESFLLFTASSGKAGLELLGKQVFAVIVSDQRMPEMSGSEFLAKARELQPDAMRIVLTGYADVQAAISAINEGGAFRYITKPWNDTDFVLMIREAVSTFGLKQENKRLTELTRAQNEELKKWNTQLEAMVQEQTLDIQNKNKSLEKLNVQLSGNFRKSIEVFSNLIEMREKTMSSHSKNVAVLSRQIAMNLKLSESDTNNVLVASLLHDVGKIGVSDAVLMKTTDAMTGPELNDYQSHAVRGQVAVDIIEGFHDIGLIIRHHHEHVDGTGFPDGLKMNEIPLGSRIIAMADAYDRMLKTGMPSADDIKQVLNSIEFYLDSRLDRKVFAAFRSVIEVKLRALEKDGGRTGEEVEVVPAKLQPGMVLSQDVRSGTGILILARGHILDQTLVSAIQRYYQLDSPKKGVFVQKKAAVR